MLHAEDFGTMKLGAATWVSSVVMLGRSSASACGTGYCSSSTESSTKSDSGSEDCGHVKLLLDYRVVPKLYLVPSREQEHHC